MRGEERGERAVPDEDAAVDVAGLTVLAGSVLVSEPVLVLGLMTAPGTLEPPVGAAPAERLPDAVLHTDWEGLVAAVGLKSLVELDGESAVPGFGTLMGGRRRLKAENCGSRTQHSTAQHSTGTHNARHGHPSRHSPPC